MLIVKLLLFKRDKESEAINAQGRVAPL